ncbi:MAG: 16S rRNA (guanine(527)-N(7))-methyltransferase RsmG [Candidatus Eisenbacteria bacterium]|uniref:Ribosomal RNA small subunit methyltransferase G n=1 Tax=Eiseniibacteriota bacterium TaxID=2212470 RepID=A0A849SG40_UNCEI|nr:16S rRNA (guanine(527)-N(7))-methyltransferase RsmG [Candidatus Eisenbacteria bacterium]
MVERQNWDSLIPHLLRLGAEPDTTLEKLKLFTRALLEWNRGASNLISAGDEVRVVERHVVESIEPAHWLKQNGGNRWLDLGSGAGFPGLLLAICGVGDHWTLVESRRNKTLFLRKICQDFALRHVKVVTERLESLVENEEFAHDFDGFTSRATMKLTPTLELANRFVVTGGQAFLWKGSGRDKEMEDAPEWRSHWRLEGLLGVGSGPNVVCRFTRTA